LGSFGVVEVQGAVRAGEVATCAAAWVVGLKV